MSPLVDESWEWTSVASLSSGSIFFASCLPNSTLLIHTKKQEGEVMCLLFIKNDHLNLKGTACIFVLTYIFVQYMLKCIKIQYQFYWFNSLINHVDVKIHFEWNFI